MDQRVREESRIGAPGDIAERLLAVLDALMAEIQPRRPAGRIDLDASLERDLGLDSLARVELLARLEQAFGVALPERAVIAAETPREILRDLLAAGSPRVVPAVPETVQTRPAAVQGTPQAARTLVEALEWHLAAHPDRPHIQFYADDAAGEALTYRQLFDNAVRVAAGLQQRGLRPGETVAIMLPTGRDYFFSFFGALLAGGVPVSLYPPARLAQIEDHLRRQGGILRNCLATLLITLPEAGRLAQLLRLQVESLQSVVTVAELAVDADAFRPAALGTLDTAFIQYTSGSTGNPKGVVLSHANLLANIRAMGERVRAGAEDVFVSWLPLYHDMGLIGAWFGSLYFASLLVIMSPLAFIARPQRWLWALHRYGGTMSAAPNFAYELCLRRIGERELEGLDLRRWRIAFNGAEPVSPETIERFAARYARYGFRREAVMPVYGLAECSVGLAFPPPGRGPLIDRVRRPDFMRFGRAVRAEAGDANAMRFVAVGQPLAGHEIRIVDGRGAELPEREQGRLQFRGPSATSGYYRNPEQTRRLFDGDWLESGDLAYEASGDIFVTGRIKDVIIRAGRNIYPHEMEEAIGDLPEIRKGRVAVFGSADPASGTERLVAIAETREHEAGVLEALRRRIQALAADLVGAPLDDVVLAPPGTVLKTSSGKIRRAASRDLYERGEIGRARRPVWRQFLRLAIATLLPELRRVRRRLQAGLYAAYAWTVFALLAPPVYLLVAIMPTAPARWAILRGAARLFAQATFTPLVVHGLEHLPPAGRPCVYVANHASFLDGYLLIAALPREFSFIVKAELLASPVSRVFLRRIDAEFVRRFDREQGRADAARAAKAAQAGRSLLFFPEGTFRRTPGLLRFHMGAFVAAAEVEVPVVPVAIRGARSILRAGSWFPRRGAVTITVAPPIETREIKKAAGGEVWVSALRLRDAARLALLRHIGEPDLGGSGPA